MTRLLLCRRLSRALQFELMDGAPVRGECIPIRLFMSALDLTPTYRNINNKFSVKLAP